MHFNSVGVLFLLLGVTYTNCSAKYETIGGCSTNNSDCDDGERTICVLTLVCTANASEIFFVNTPEMLCSKDQVQEIRFKHCRAPKIADNFLSSFKNIHLMDMSDLGIETLDAKSFIGATNLVTLKAPGNEITEIPEMFFQECTSLKYVDFSFNGITNFDSNVFNNGNVVSELNLGYNQIKNLSVLTFQNLLNLETIKLQGNQIVEVPSFLFKKLKKLQNVNFSYNDIEIIEEFAIHGAVNLKTLTLRFNRIRSLDRLIFYQTTLTSLDISYNQIAFFETGTMDYFRNLEYFDVSGNPLLELQANTFHNLVNLKSLKLSQTNLTAIVAGLFENQKKLETLDLSRNELKTLSADILPRNLSQMLVLSIANNQLRELNGFKTSQMFNLKIAGIETNDFSCYYLEELFENITTQHLDTVFSRINCTDNGETDRSDQTEFSTESSIEATWTSTLTLLADKVISSTSSAPSDPAATPEIQLKNDRANGTTTQQIHIDNSSNKLLLDAVQNMHKLHSDIIDHLFVIVCFMTTLLSIVLFVIVWKIFRWRTSNENLRRAQVTYRSDEIEKVNPVDNLYEGIFINKEF